MRCLITNPSRLLCESQLENARKIKDASIKVVSSNCIQDLRQSHIDLAIRFKVVKEEDNHQYGLMQEFVGEDSVYPVCSPKLAQEMNFKEPKELLKCWLVHLENQGEISWETWFDTANVKGYQQHKERKEWKEKGKTTKTQNRKDRKGFKT